MIDDEADELMPIPGSLHRLGIARDEYDEALAQHGYAEQRLMFWKIRLNDLERNIADLRARVMSELEEGLDV